MRPLTGSPSGSTEASGSRSVPTFSARTLLCAKPLLTIGPTHHPNNVWALHGLVECLKGRGESKELLALQARLATALAKADVPINSSCLCKTSAQSEQSFCYPTKS